MEEGTPCLEDQLDISPDITIRPGRRIEEEYRFKLMIGVWAYAREQRVFGPLGRTNEVAKQSYRLLILELLDLVDWVPMPISPQSLGDRIDGYLLMCRCKALWNLAGEQIAFIAQKAFKDVLDRPPARLLAAA